MFTARHTNHTGADAAVLPGKASPFFQPKLTINQPDDVYEQEADAIADKVMRIKDDSAEPFFKPSARAVQRKCKHCEQEQVQRKENEVNGPVASSQTEDYINSLSGGKPLTAGERSFFEPRFGYDFSDVRLHTGGEAGQSANSIQALAYTHRNHIVFGNGQYQPDSEAGKKLIAHELTHVVQQNSGIAPKVIQRYPWPYPLHMHREVDETSSETISGAPAAYAAWNGTYQLHFLFRIELNAVAGAVTVLMRLHSTASLRYGQPGKELLKGSGATACIYASVCRE